MEGRFTSAAHGHMQEKHAEHYKLNTTAAIIVTTTNKIVVVVAAITPERLLFLMNLIVCL